MPSDQKEYFEGEIEYQLDYEALSPEINYDDIFRKSPDTRIQRFKDGNYVSENYKNDKLTGRTWHDRSSHRIYIQSAESDTLYFYDTRNLDFDLEPFEVTDGEEILGHPTKKITLKFKGKDSSDYLPNASQYTFHIATDLTVNPDWYKDYLEFDMNKMMEAVPGIVVKEEDVISEQRIVTRTATRIERKQVELDLSVDSTKVLVEI